MKPMLERVRSLLLIPMLIALLLTGNGCSMLIASRDASYLPTITPGSTRQEVRQTLGDPESSETRGDGMRFETYHIHIREKVTSAWKGMEPPSFGGGGPYGAFVVIPVAFLFAFLFEVYATSKAIYDSKEHNVHITLVYGPDDRLLFSYDVNHPPELRFVDVSRQLDYGLWEQLESDQCPAWSACLASYFDERRRRAAWVGHTLPPIEEENSRHLLAVAREKDDEHMTKGEALIRSAGLSIAPDEKSPSDERFSATRDPLDKALAAQLEHGGCPAWLPCFTSYSEELRRRAAAVSYTMRPKDEEVARHLLAVARDRDDGRITEGGAHIGIAGREGNRWLLDHALRKQLGADGCPSWVACVTIHENERRRQVAADNVTLTPEEENDMRQRLKIAADVDEGRMTKTDALQALP